MSDLHPPRVPNGTKHRLLVLPGHPADLHPVTSTERCGCGRGDAAVHEGKLEAFSDPLLGQVLQDEVAGVVLVSGSRDHQGSDRQTGDIDGDDPLGAPGAPVRSASVMERASPLDAPRARWVPMTTIDGTGSPRRAAVLATACKAVSARAHVPLADQRRNCDHTRVQGP